MVPDAGVAASEDGNGVKTIDRAQMKTTRTMPEAVNTDNLKIEVLNFLLLLAFLPFAGLQEG
jgi:hypothetical protein